MANKKSKNRIFTAFTFSYKNLLNSDARNNNIINLFNYGSERTDFIKAGLLVPEDQEVNIIPMAADHLNQNIYDLSIRTSTKVLNKKVLVN